MSQHDDRVRLRHMRDYAAEAIQLSQGRARSDLDSDRLYSLAMIRLVELIGEAASRISAGLQSQHPQIPWGPIIGARNRLIHGYDRVDLRIIWDTIEYDLPRLIETLRGTFGED